VVSLCPKIANTRSKCAKCNEGHKIDNCGLKCSFCFGLRHMEEKCWKKNLKGTTTVINFLKVVVNDEKTTLFELNKICNTNHDLLFGIKMPKKNLPIILSFARKIIEEMTNEENNETSNVGVEVIVRFMILSHFIKGKISLTPMEIILIISSELEYLECLIKLARKQKDVEANKIQMVVVQKTHVISQVNVN
jgi:hypothetical protein